MAPTIQSLADKFGKSSRMIRNYVACISEATGNEPFTAPGIVADWVVDEVAKIVELGGPAAYKRSMQPVTVLEPTTPVCDMATQSGHELASQAQPTQPAFTPVTDVAIAPAHPIPHFTVIAGGLSTATTTAIPTIPQQSPVMGLGDVGSQILASNASAQSAAAAITQMMDALMIRMQVGMDANHAQSQIGTQEEEELATKLAEFRAVAAEYDRQARVSSIRENLRADRVGKLVGEMTQVAGRAGFQLCVQSPSVG